MVLSKYNALILPHINYCLLSWGSGSVGKNILLKQNRATRAIFCAGYNAHTEPLFKIYKLLKIDDIYNCRLLVPYYNLVYNNVPQYLSPMLPNTSLATNRYPIRHPRLQPPFHSHPFISQTCKYNLPVLLNSINNQSDELTVIVRNVDNTSLSGFKNLICLVNTRMSVLFRIVTFVRFNYFKHRCFVSCVPRLLLGVL